MGPPKNQIPIRCTAISVAILRGKAEAARVLLLRRTRGPLAGMWCQVTGGIEAEETGWQAAIREVTEETSLRPRQLYSADFCDFFYDPSTNFIEAVPMFVAIVSEGDVPILNDENSEFCWFDALEASELVPFVGHRLALREIARDFIDREPLKWRLITDCSSG